AANPAATHALDLLLATVMTASALTLAPLPSAALVFVAGTAAACAAPFVLTGRPVAAAIAVTLAALLAAIALSRARAVARLDAAGRFAGYRGVVSDITEQRASAERINRMARFDALTGLPNRLSVNDELTRALSEAERWRARCAFMMIDLDRFKAVNDTLG